MLLTNKIKDSEIDSISKQIFWCIKSEQNLTDRTLKYIALMLKKSCFYVAKDRIGKICGFIAKERICENYYEVKCWYVNHDNRGSGLANQLFNRVVEGDNCRYLSSTFDNRIVEKLKTYHFKIIKLTDLPWRVGLAYIYTRNVSSILKHGFLSKSYLLLR